IERRERSAGASTRVIDHHIRRPKLLLHGAKQACHLVAVLRVAFKRYRARLHTQRPELFGIAGSESDGQSGPDQKPGKRGAEAAASPYDQGRLVSLCHRVPGSERSKHIPPRAALGSPGAGRWELIGAITVRSFRIDRLALDAWRPATRLTASQSRGRCPFPRARCGVAPPAEPRLAWRGKEAQSRR